MVLDLSPQPGNPLLTSQLIRYGIAGYGDPGATVVVAVSPVPEPSAWYWLAGAGSLGVAATNAIRKRKMRVK